MPTVIDQSRQDGNHSGAKQGPKDLQVRWGVAGAGPQGPAGIGAHQVVDSDSQVVGEFFS